MCRVLRATRLGLWIGLVATALIAFGQHAAWATEVPFVTQPAISTTADGAISVFGADVDGDGDTDVLSASNLGDKIAWYENTDGAGTFSAEQVISTLTDAVWSVFAADVDGDGDTDVLSASFYDDKIAWYENTDGAGTFSAEQVISTLADGAISVFAADVDGDGDTDVLSASNTDDKIAWYENTDGAGTFGPQQVISTLADGGRTVSAADLDGDGDTDVLSGADASGTSFVGDKIVWYENTDGAETFSAPQVIESNVTAGYAISAADLDGDEDNDVLVASYHEVGWYENTDGAGTFSAQHVISLAALADSVFAADVDGDGDTDVLSASEVDDQIAWYENTDGAGTFSAQQVISTAADGAQSVFAADVDGDGDADVLSASYWDDKVAWYENKTIHRSAEFPAQAVISTAANSLWSTFAADVDGDGDTDVLSASELDDKIAWYENTDGAGTFSAQHVISTLADGAYSVFAVDVDGDEDADVLSASFLDDKIAWYENTDGAGTFGAQQVISTLADGAQTVFAADVDGDGDMDVLSASGADDKIAWYANTDGAGTFGAQQVISTLANGAFSVFAADVDGDADTDVLSASQFDDKIAWYENTDGAGTFGMQQVISSLADYATSVFAADVDGDGDTDVLSASGVDDEIAWYENTDGAGTFSAQQVVSTLADAAWSVFAADVDGDGDTDVLSASAFDDKIAWYENTDGVGTFGTQQVISTTADYPRSVFAADVDGDGDTDVLSASANDDKIAWYENRGGQFALTTTDTAPATIDPGATDDVLKIVLTHNGRAGDTEVELATLELLFEENPGDALTSAEGNALIENLHVYLDDGSVVFESGSDTLVATAGTLALTSGVQTVTLTDGDANVHVEQGTPRIYFVVAETKADAATPVPNRFRVTHRTESSSTAQDAGADIPLALEYAANVPSGFVDVPPQVITVVPQDNALGVPVGTNVTITFSRPVDSPTVTTSTFRLVAPGGAVVSASVGLAPDGVTATLDPSSGLALGTIYTVEVTSGVEDPAGTPAVPFTSRFETTFVVAGIPLPAVSDQSVLPSPPPAAPPGRAAVLGTGANLGYSVASAGDLDNDGLGDFVGGAPGYSPSGTAEAGVVAVYFGNAAPEPPSGNHPRAVAEIIFEGSAAHDRAGSSVASGFDFNGDGLEDFLIGAEQVDRTQEPPVVTGAGKVYLILFKPLEYDRAPVDGVPDYMAHPEMFVSLSEVGVTISGMVLTGAASGDQAGYSVVGGGRLESGDLRDDIVIGAPGASGDDGKVYVVFSDPALCGGAFGTTAFCGVKALGDVGSTVSGRVYRGQTSTAERLGTSVALPGDVTAPVGPDIALGAPLADTTEIDAGRVYVAPGGSLTSGTVNASTIATRIDGDQPCEQLGFTVAGGGDNRAAGTPTLPGGDFDLLIGAPYHDPNTSTGDPCLGTTPMPDAGRVVQTSGRLAGVIQASGVGTTLPGIIWRGTQAEAHLGWSVARLGDMSGNGLEDIALGAPNANPGMSDAGAVYVIEGSANVGLLGTMDASLVGQTVSGGIFLGTQPSERAGLVIAGAGDLDGDTTSAPNDFTVGSPGWDGEQGTVHQVLESILQQPGECTALGCTVADLATGALLEVPENALAAGASYRFAVRGLVTAPACSLAPPGKTLVGTSDDTRIDCGSPPCTPPGFGIGPDIEVPTRAEVEYQLVNGEALELRYCDSTLGWRLLSAPGPGTGTVQANTFLADRKAVRAEGVDTLRLYGVFFQDGDGDGTRASCDCADSDATLWDRPGPVGNLLLSRVAGTTLTWTAPLIPGGTAAVRYDTVRSANRSNFVTGAVCVEGDGTDTAAVDATNPAPGQIFYYIIVPQNNCPSDPACFNPGLPAAVECTGP